MEDQSPSTDRRRRLAGPKLLGAAVAFFGGAALVAWYVSLLELVTVEDRFVPMQYNTALGFVVTGLAVVAHCVGNRRLAYWGGVAAAGIGSLALSEVLLDHRFSIWSLFTVGAPIDEGERMSAITALCFALSGCLLLTFRSPGTSRRWRGTATAVVAGIIVACGFVGLLGYVLHDAERYGWARLTQMNANTAVGFVGLGFAFFIMIGRYKDVHRTAPLPRWVPYSVGTLIAGLTVAVWINLASSADQMRSLARTRSHEATVAQTNLFLQRHLRDLHRVARHYDRPEKLSQPLFERLVQQDVEGVEGLVCVSVIDERGAVVHEAWIEDASGSVDPGPEITDTARQVLTDLAASVRGSGRPALTDPLEHDGRRQDFYVVVPSGREGHGAFLFRHDTTAFLDAFFRHGYARAFRVELGAENGDVFYRSYDDLASGRTAGNGEDFVSESSGRIAVGDHMWWVRASGDPALLAGARREANALILWFGIFLAVSTALVIRQSEQVRQRALSLAEAKLTIEAHAAKLRDANASLERQAEELQAKEGDLRRAADDRRVVLDSLSAFVIGIDGGGCVMEWNSVASEIFDLPPEAVMGKPFASVPMPWDDEIVADAIERCVDSGERIRCDNLRLEVSVAPDPDSGKTCADVGSDGTADDEDARRIVSFTVNPTQETGRGFSLIGADVTERKQLETQLHHAQKLEAVGTLAAGIAHEINTPMQYVSDNLRFVSEQVGPLMQLVQGLPDMLDESERGEFTTERAAEIREALEEMDVEFVADELPLALSETLEGVDRVTSIVRAMKDFSHPGGEGRTPSDLNRAIETTLAVARNEYKYIANVETDLGDLPLIECWVADLNQVFLNLLVNAAHAIQDKLGEDGGLGLIRLSSRRDGDHVEVRLGDSGAGIPQNVLNRIFDPFFTTKEVGRGTGQGLAIARAVVVDKHGGSLGCESELGVGTTFIIRLPVTGEPDPSAEEGSEHEHADPSAVRR